MFNGLIKEIANIKNLNGDILTLQTKYKPQIGDSINVNGACLTATQINNDGFCVQISPHTKHTLALNKLQNKAHIEPAMSLGDKVDGHFLQGHIDFIGTIKDIKKNDNCYDFYIQVPQQMLKFCSPKGSIGIDGISLTIGDTIQKDNIIKITIIKHTYEQTLLNTYKIGEKLNCESDMFARYIFNILQCQTNTINNSQNNTNINYQDKTSWNYIDGLMARY
jgi:riboflavin synthase